MKIKFFYQNKKFFKDYFDNKNDPTSEYKSVAAPAFLLFFNLISVYFLFIIGFIDLHKLLALYVSELNIPFFVKFIFLCATFFGFMFFISGKPEWNHLSKKEVVIQKIYVLGSIIGFPIVCMILLIWWI